VELNTMRIAVTGGAGFLGSALVDSLRRRGCTDVAVPRRRDYDLTEALATERFFVDVRPQVLFHLAATVGGIGANRRNPGRFFYENAMMGLHVIECARRYGLAKVVLVGTVCSYPKFTPTPFQETALWDGYPEETNAPYGIAKKALLVLSQAYRTEYGLRSIFLIPTNLYGPRDNFDAETSHVIPALLRKFLEAKAAGASEVVLWGDGSATREFLYVEDAGEALVLAAERYDDSEPVNVGSGEETSIADLAVLVARLCEYDGRLVWDASQPNGQPRRRLDTSRAHARFGFRATTPLQAGLERTIAWYTRQLEATRSLETSRGLATLAPTAGSV
jgi:GDP-L-fucose synthase